jgi:SAM-dependent methyltransferase
LSANTGVCPLCQGTPELFYGEEFLICKNCKGIFRPQPYLPDPQREKKRYEFHRNDLNDGGYREFAAPVTDYILNSFSEDQKGLDFGSGRDSAVSAILSESGFRIEMYDPFFRNVPSLLEDRYDYIVCCEVIEHFHNPRKDFSLLCRLLKPGGSLICMTSVYSNIIDFKNWYYKNDFTHVFFYQPQTLEFIKSDFGFSSLIVTGNLAIFRN